MNKTLLRRIVPLVLLVFIMVFLMPRDAKFPYEYKVGKTWRYETLYAQFDFPILKSENQLREERSNATTQLVPYFNYSEEETTKVLKAVENLELGSLRKAILSELKDIYHKGVLADDTRSNRGEIPDAEVYVILKDKKATKYPQTEIFRQSSAKKQLLSSLIDKTDINVDSLLKDKGLYNYIIPNLFYDKHTTTLVQEESSKEISPTLGYVNLGQLIVSEDEIVTAEIAQKIDSYKEEFESNAGYLRSPLIMGAGNFLIILSLVALLFLSIYIAAPKAFNDSRYFILINPFALLSCLCLLLERLGGDYAFLVPFTLLVICYRSFFGAKQSLLFYLVSLLPLLVISRNGVVLFVMFLGSGVLVLLLYNSYQRVRQQLVRILVTFGSLVLFLFAFRASGLITGNIWRQIALLLLNSLLSLAGLPLLSLFESIHNLVSDSRLVELGDTSSKVMRLMEQKAPGSFQHSIQLMNMAETVSRAVGVNPELLRVAALYHDIGKIRNPLCFVENETLLLSEDQKKYHENISAEQSAKDIIRHIEDGLAVATEYHLPKLVKDFIATHHGTTCVRYFYDKHLKAGGSEASRAEFCYPGPKPSSKAQLILMLCDSVEAAARTLKAKTQEAYSQLVEDIVATKMEEGQFDEVNITFAELNTIKETIKSYLVQLNHNRIVYPKK